MLSSSQFVPVLAVGLKLLAAGEGDAFLSAGNTGALVFGATFLVKRLEGVKRPALAVAVPCEKGCYLLLDAGANSECRPEHLMQFAIMGSVYAEKVLQIAFAQQERGADIAKIVTRADSQEEEIENLRATSLLKEKCQCRIGSVAFAINGRGLRLKFVCGVW